MSARRRGRARGDRRSLAPEDVKAELADGASIALMQALGLVSSGGGASASANRKLKQITHFAGLVRPALDDVFARYEQPQLVDAAAGKAYLGLALYELWAHRQGRGVLHAVEQRPELCARVRNVCDAMAFGRVDVVEGSVLDAPLPERVHFVLALHACDTATDEALVRAVAAGADHVAVVPCCQAEVARQLRGVDSGAVAPLWRDGHHRREFGAHLTNVIRTLWLRSHGYQVTVTELVGWEHAVKNELILGRRVGRFHRGAWDELTTLLDQIPVRPWLLDQLPSPVPGAESETHSSGSGLGNDAASYRAATTSSASQAPPAGDSCSCDSDTGP